MWCADRLNGISVKLKCARNKQLLLFLWNKWSPRFHLIPKGIRKQASLHKCELIPSVYHTQINPLSCSRPKTEHQFYSSPGNILSTDSLNPQVAFQTSHVRHLNTEEKLLIIRITHSRQSSKCSQFTPILTHMDKSHLQCPSKKLSLVRISAPPQINETALVVWM